MSVKRILIITSELVPFHYGGIGTQFKSLAAFLQRRGHHVFLMTRKPEGYDESIYRSHYGDIDLFFVEDPPLRTGAPQHFAYAAEIARRFDEIKAETRPDLVIIADYNAEGFFLLLQSEAGLHGDIEFLLTINGMTQEVISVYEGAGTGMPCSSMDIPEIRSILAMEEICVHLAPRIVSPTLCAWNEVRQRIGSGKAARIIPNLVDLDLFQPETAGLRQESREPLILFIGRLDRMKGADLLLKAYLEIAGRTYPLHPRMIFIGRDCNWKEYHSTFLEYWKARIPERYDNAVTFLGQVSHDQIRTYLRKAAVAVFPSRWEPFGIVCLEALSMGCPVVVSRGTGLEEVLGPELAEFTVPITDDIRPLVEKIQDVLDGNIFAASEKLRGRALGVVQRAEEGWMELLRNLDQKEPKEPMERSFSGPAAASLLRLLLSLDDRWRGINYLQIYVRNQGQYSEANSVRVPYPLYRWTTPKIQLHSGTGERFLRMDPADAAGVVRIREIYLLDEAGTEIWRDDSSTSFRGCRIEGTGSRHIDDGCLVIHFGNNDPQILIDCPVMNQPVQIHVALFAGE